MKITKKQIDKVIEGFNFEQAAQIYKLLNWKWFDVGIPNEDHIRDQAVRLLGDLKKCFDSTIYKGQKIMSGGLVVSGEVEGGLIKVRLQLVALSSVHDNLDVE